MPRRTDISSILLIGAVLLVASCRKREVPEFAAAARACGVPYYVVENAFVRSSSGRGVRNIALGRCEVDRDPTGRVSARFVKTS